MIEPSDEMLQVAEEAAHDHGVFLHDHQSKAILTAVLALVERDYGLAGPCSVVLPSLFDGETGTWCELRHGHTGDHESGPTRWKPATPPQ